MDKSEQFIKMCDCPEIQKQWKPKVGDRFWHDNEGGYYEPTDTYEFPAGIGIVGSNNCGSLTSIWLPTQSDLQGMVKGSDIYKLRRCDDFWHIDVHDQRKYEMPMEQLWLAFVMHELHQKKWDGEKWVKEE